MASVFTPHPRNVIVNSDGHFFTVEAGKPQFTKNRNFAYTYDSLAHAQAQAELVVATVDNTAVAVLMSV